MTGQGSAHEPHPRRYRWRAIGFYLLALVVMVAVLGGFLLDQYRQEIQDGFERTRARADMVAKWVGSTFVASDLTLVGIAQLLDQGIDSDHLSTLLAQRRDSLAVVNEVTLLDAQGRVIASSSPALSPGRDLSDTPALRHFRDTPDLNHWVTPLYQSGERGSFGILHLHRLSGLAEEGERLALVQLDPSVFGHALGRLDMTEGESIAIIDTGMSLIARRPAFSEGDPLDVVGTPISEPLTEAFLASGDAVAQVRTDSPLDGRERLYTFQRIGELPFVAVVGEETGVMLAGWRLRLGILGGIGLVVALLGGLVLRHYLSRLRLEGVLCAHVAEREQARQEIQAREARLQALVGSIQDMIYVFDAEGRFIYVHAVDESHLKHPTDGVLERHYRDVLPEDVAKEFDRALAEVNTTGQPVEFDYPLVAAGEPREFHAVVSPLAESGGGYGGVLALIRDVTQSRATEAQLRIAATAFETHLGMMITDAEGYILKVNQTFTRITGYGEEEVQGRRPSLLSSGHHDAFFYQQLWEKVAQRGSWEGEIWNRRKNGDIYPEWLTLSAVRNAAGELTHHVATLSDISERKAAEREIHQLAFFDPLTGLPNRRLMLDRLHSALKDTNRSQQYGALISLDLDNFKQVNDTLGHYQGDQLLQQITRRLEVVLRDTDTLARLGGDEFAVLLHDLGAEPERVATLVERIAQKLMGVLQQAIPVGGEMRVVTCSIGITLFHDHNTTIDEILQQADMALFQAKAAGGNTLSFFDPAMQERMQARVRVENDLRMALPRGEFRLHYQRQFDAAGETTGVEALLRWEHPQRGMVSPGEFIPLAEESRLIVAIGDWVMETACHQLVAWADDPAKAHLRISVNVSPRQFHEADFVERVTAILARTGAPATRLELEVTESLFVEDRDDARGKMLRLKALGVAFALDDFGTGYSSLSYLKRLPLDRLKIDQSFVRDLHDDEASAAIVASTIALSSSLKLEVIAEGVETRAQRDWLIEHGCRAFQGFLFCRPMPVESLTFETSTHTV